MQLLHLNTLDMGRRVQGFLDANAAIIGDRVGPKARKQLDEAVAQLAALQIEQSRAVETARSETVNQTTWRRDLFQTYLRPVKRIAQRSLRDAPDYQALIVSAPFGRQGDFLNQVIRATNAAAGYEQKLIEGGMPVDFMARLQEAIVRLTASTQNRFSQQTIRSAATAGLDVAKKSVTDVVGIIGGVIAPVLRQDDALLAGWNAARLVRQPVVTPLRAGSTTPSDTTVGGTTPPADPVPPVAPDKLAA